MKGIKDKVVLITGGANGIGLATAAAFVEFGATIALVDLDREAGLIAEQALNENSGSQCKYFFADTGAEPSIASMAESVISHFGQVDVLVNGAACFLMEGIEADESVWQRTCQVNIAGYALCAKYIVPSMIKNGGGAIVNICSISAHIAQPEFVTYNSSKGAISSMTRCMALDLAKHNIRVNAISPGTVWTKSNEIFHRENLNCTRDEAEKDANGGGKHVVKRYADPQEIAYPIVFLASDYASFVVGADLMVDGGYTII